MCVGENKRGLRSREILLKRIIAGAVTSSSRTDDSEDTPVVRSVSLQRRRREYPCGGALSRAGKNRAGGLGCAVGAMGQVDGTSFLEISQLSGGAFKNRSLHIVTLAQAAGGSKPRVSGKDSSVTNVGQGSKNFVEIGACVETVQLVIMRQRMGF